MPQTTGLPAGPTSTHRTQPTNSNCKRNAPGARGSICLPRAPLFLSLWGAGCLPLGALCLARTASFAFPMPLVPLPEHKNPDFVLETPENGGFRHQKRTKTSILCSKRPKTRVPKAKAHKNPDFVLEKKGERHRKRRNWHREAQPWPSCKSPRTLLNCKYLITRRLTFADVLGELKSRPSSTLQKYKYLITR